MAFGLSNWIVFCTENGSLLQSKKPPARSHVQSNKKQHFPRNNFSFFSNIHFQMTHKSVQFKNRSYCYYVLPWSQSMQLGDDVAKMHLDKRKQFITVQKLTSLWLIWFVYLFIYVLLHFASPINNFRPLFTASSYLEKKKSERIYLMKWRQARNYMFRMCENWEQVVLLLKLAEYLQICN